MNHIQGNKIIAVSRKDKRLNAFLQGGIMPSFSMPPEVVAVQPHAFDNIDGLREVIFTNDVIVVTVADGSGIPSGAKFVVPSQLYSDYVSRYPNRDVVSYETGYQWVVPFVEGETSTTLTANYIIGCLAENPEAKKARKVIVPVEFTAYESGAIQYLEDHFDNLEHLVTNYEYGSIDLNMNGDIVAKITAMNKTVDEALVMARAFDPLYKGDLPNNIIIVPPQHFVADGNSQVRYEDFGSTDSLVYLADLNLSGSFSRYFQIIKNANLVYLKIDFRNLTSFSPAAWNFSQNPSLKYMYMYGVTKGFNISGSTQFTRQSLIDLINSLGTPSTTQTLTIGATNLAKLTSDDIQLATDKNWVLA